MSVLSIRNVSYSIGARPLFTDLTFAIEQGDRIALVGLNGAGKSTLLQLLAGAVVADAGVIARRSGAVIEYVPQVLPKELAHVTLFSALVEKLPEAFRVGGFEYLVEARLESAGFAASMHSRTLGELSGGEVNRALLARALMAEPDLVLLDEPTNHMDIEQVARFESFLREELHVAVLIVSHDRALLDAVTTRTLFLRDQRLYGFDLPFSEAREALAHVDEAARLRRQDEEKELERLRVSANRLAEWGKVYGNEKFSQRARSMKKRIDRLEEQKTFVPRAIKADVRLETEASSSPFVLDVRGLTVRDPRGKELLSIERLSLRRGERLAIVGRNGCGKSTLLRTIVTRMRGGMSSQEISFNPTTRLGYYEQDLKHFGAHERIAEAVAARCELPTQRLVTELITAGFAYDRHSSLVSSLSGGERARLTFLVLKLSQPNLLILDEPTNHLDVEGIEHVEQALREGEGSVLFVSHDRRFLERVATRVVELPLEDLNACGELDKRQ